MSRHRILIQLDPDQQPSVFDSVVAVDAGVDQLFRHGNVTPEQVQNLVHGAMFTRSSQNLKHTAVFIGGSNVSAGEALLDAARKSFFGPIRVSVMLDSNGCNTTAAAAVLVAAQHLQLTETTATVLAATGPVGARVTQLLAAQGATVRVASRQLNRARDLCARVAEQVAGAELVPVQTDSEDSISTAFKEAQLAICAGAAGVPLLSESVRRSTALNLAIDLNAVPPLGIEGIEASDNGKDYDGVICYGAIGIGGTKMKIHNAAIERLFESNDQVLDAEAIFAIGQAMTVS
ncbi:MAG: NAD(P)-dependent methylenetetrahydromethanopterin dehydrogenase [Pirellulales bacterium]